MKIIDTLASANANLARNKVRTTLTIIAIMVGAFTLALTLGINTGVNRYIDAQLGSIGGKNTMIIMPKTDEAIIDTSSVEEYSPRQADSTGNARGGSSSTPIPITKEILQKINNIKGVHSADAYNLPEADYITNDRTDKKFVISVAETVAGLTIDMETGNAPNNNTDRPQISLEPRFVSELGYSDSAQAIGQEIELGVTDRLTGESITITATISGVQATALMNDGLSYINTALSQKIINTTSSNGQLPQPVYMAIATLEDNLSDETISSIKKQIADLGFQAQTVDDQIGVVRSVINAITGVLTMFATIALIAASFGIINTLYMAVQERTREIGLMKAMGLSNLRVFLMFSLEAILIGFWGSVIGIGLAMVAGIGINEIAQTSFLGDLTGFILIQFSMQNSLLITGIICLIAFLAGTMPAVRASKLNPIEALRYE